jgi:hypothetical protein
MSPRPESANHQELEVPEQGSGSRSQVAHIGEVCRPQAPFGEKPSEYVEIAVFCGDGRRDEAPDPDGLGIGNLDEIETGFPPPR